MEGRRGLPQGLADPLIGLLGDLEGDRPGEQDAPLPGDPPSDDSWGDRGDTDRRPLQPPTLEVKVDLGIWTGAFTGHACTQAHNT